MIEFSFENWVNYPYKSVLGNFSAPTCQYRSKDHKTPSERTTQSFHLSSFTIVYNMDNLLSQQGISGDSTFMWNELPGISLSPHESMLDLIPRPLRLNAFFLNPVPELTQLCWSK